MQTQREQEAREVHAQYEQEKQQVEELRKLHEKNEVVRQSIERLTAQQNDIVRQVEEHQRRIAEMQQRVAGDSKEAEIQQDMQQKQQYMAATAQALYTQQQSVAGTGRKEDVC